MTDDPYWFIEDLAAGKYTPGEEEVFRGLNAQIPKIRRIAAASTKPSETTWTFEGAPDPVDPAETYAITIRAQNGVLHAVEHPAIHMHDVDEPLTVFELWAVNGRVTRELRNPAVSLDGPCEGAVREWSYVYGGVVHDARKEMV
jgi:hypothetical protein